LTGLAIRWFFGSIAEKLIRLVHVPLLLVRTEKPASSAKVFGWPADGVVVVRI